MQGKEQKGPALASTAAIEWIFPRNLHHSFLPCYYHLQVVLLFIFFNYEGPE